MFHFCNRFYFLKKHLFLSQNSNAFQNGNKKFKPQYYDSNFLWRLFCFDPFCLSLKLYLFQCKLYYKPLRKTSVNWVLCCLPFGSTMNLGEPLMGISNLGDLRYVDVVWCAYSKFELEIRSERERERERERKSCWK